MISVCEIGRMYVAANQLITCRVVHSLISPEKLCLISMQAQLSESRYQKENVGNLF